MAWRRAWARDWDEVRWCSDGCRRRRSEVAGPDGIGRRLEGAILDLLAGRRSGATICPSEAARAVGGEAPEAWRPLMEPAREAARRLAAAGELDVVQRGVVVDPSTARGPIRLRRR
jgi:hypothetical protein